MTFKDQTPSPSRRYVAVCYRSKFEGVYFRKFTLPESCPHVGHNNEGLYFCDKLELENTVATATWYFLNKLNLMACIEDIITEEDYNSVEEHK